MNLIMKRKDQKSMIIYVEKTKWELQKKDEIEIRGTKLNRILEKENENTIEINHISYWTCTNEDKTFGH